MTLLMALVIFTLGALAGATVATVAIARTIARHNP